jgi:hypothetical protein
MIITNIKETDVLTMSHPISVDASAIPNAVLKRLIDEVQFENQNNISAYNRSHNRHNRS